MRISICRAVVIVLTMWALVSQGVAATPKPANLVIGTGPIMNVGSWSGYSAINLIPATSVLPVSSTTAVFYLAFTAGTQADISNMVVYKTKPNSKKVTAVTPVKLGGVSNPVISLTNTSVCPVQPVSVSNPCIVRLDPTTITLSSASDFYFVAYFTASDSNNASLGAASNAFTNPSITGFFEAKDDTNLAVGQSLPASNDGHSYFLLAVMND